jgi:hypothetical protein
MSHPPEGLLRRAVDEPAALADADRLHVAGCERCTAELAAATADRDVVTAALGWGDARETSAGETSAGEVSARTGADAGAAAADLAWPRLMARLHGGADAESATSATVVALPPAPRRASRLRRPVVAVAVATVLAVGSTAAAAANDWLPIFQPRQVEAVTLDLDLLDVTGMPDLSAYGDVVLPPGGLEPDSVPSAAKAASRTGIDLPEITALPHGVTGKPTYQVIDQTTVGFTFSAAKARAAAARTGKALPPMPAGVDGTTLQIRVGPGIMQTWGGGGEAGMPKLAVARMTAPVASTEGVSLPTLRDYLLAQPGIPAEVAAQLKELPDDGSVLPVPVPSHYATTRSTMVDGVRATLVLLKDGSGGGIVWIKDGQLTVVGGLLSADELTGVARDLH